MIRNAHLEFSGGGQFNPDTKMVHAPRVDARPLPAWGAYARNVLHFTLEDVRFSLAQDDARPVILADSVARLSLDALRFPRVPGVVNPLVTTNVGKLEMRNTDLSRE